MFPSNCSGCAQVTFWPSMGYITYPPSEMFSFPRKTQSFRISDILHPQNSSSTSDFSSSIPLAFGPSKSTSGSALGPLQAFCTVKRVQNFVAQSSTRSSSPVREDAAGPKSLKFGMSRILSEEFGKDSQGKENRNHRPNTSCGCGEPSCNFPRYTRISYPSPTLTAVHALQPPHYPTTTSQNNVDALPGPYSILNEDSVLQGHSKRKRSWSRAVFSNLQRKGLEKRFEVQKYVTKPDRRQLAAMLGLTDAQVKVWFQNRRMKWRHACAQQAKEKDDTHDEENEARASDSEEELQTDSQNTSLNIDEDEIEPVVVNEDQMGIETPASGICNSNGDSLIYSQTDHSFK